ncbi:phosphoribosylanthranilate isomerase [Roseovarius aestuarii]|uniref:N-(5'-phosphoribosyl)anthranilate isomerase n=1 Tax=Roseovarius aestuarii TaxID=475083 RepID=A0A1X7BVC3_9RHOB|nr:phosphoribosylanthranilate isomerase [Roseovarius aestuarii]SMC13612.1 N-(5'-phosphoribosyl)anthranilate isomerase [Roseovarius aestuarii]
MPQDIRVKICGLTRPSDVSAAVDAGASYLGFNFFPRSPRYLDFPDAAVLAVDVPDGVAKVALTVDADDDLLDALTGTVPLDMLQLHGSETPERVLAVKSRYGLPVIKVVGVATKDDLPLLDLHARVADQLLVDAKPPPGADRPGGNALAFDWNLIAGRRWSVPWMLAGGLTPENVAEGIARTGAKQVDVASGVESAPGVKDAQMIADFVSAAQA